MSKTFIEPLFRNSEHHQVTLVPDDAEYVSSYHHDNFVFIFRSEEWSEVPEGGRIPLHQPEVRRVKCEECGNMTFYDDIKETTYCPVCDK